MPEFWRALLSILVSSRVNLNPRHAPIKPHHVGVVFVLVCVEVHTSGARCVLRCTPAWCYNSTPETCPGRAQDRGRTTAQPSPPRRGRSLGPSDLGPRAAPDPSAAAAASPLTLSSPRRPGGRGAAATPPPHTGRSVQNPGSKQPEGPRPQSGSRTRARFPARPGDRLRSS